MEYADLTVGKEIGQGAFGMVFKGRWKHWEGEVAIKSVLSDVTKEV